MVSKERVDVNKYLGAPAETDQAAKLRALATALAEGMADAAADRTVPVTEAFARIRAQLGIGEEEQAG